MAAENYYPDEEQPMGDTSTTATPIPKKEEEEDEGEETALLPMSLFPGMDLKPGDTKTIKVVRVYEDEVEVCPADKEGGDLEEEETEEPEGSMSGAMGRLGALGQEG